MYRSSHNAKVGHWRWPPHPMIPTGNTPPSTATSTNTHKNTTVAIATIKIKKLQPKHPHHCLNTPTSCQTHQTVSKVALLWFCQQAKSRKHTHAIQPLPPLFHCCLHHVGMVTSSGQWWDSCHCQQLELQHYLQLAVPDRTCHQYFGIRWSLRSCCGESGKQQREQ